MLRFFCNHREVTPKPRPILPSHSLGLAALLAVGLAFPAGLLAMQQDGCGAGTCTDCHSLSKDEAKGLLKELPLEVLNVELSVVPGMWAVDVQNRQGRKGPVFVDFSKQYVFSGNIMKLDTKEDVTLNRTAELNPVDTSIIPLEDALVIGNPEAKHRVIVFDDPQCKYCKKLHPEMKKLTARRDDVVFYIKMFPLNPKSKEIAKSIVCGKSAELLEASLAGRTIPPADCETNQLEQNVDLGRSIGVRSTPTLVFPDGRVLSGYKSAESIEELLMKVPESGG